MTRTTTYTITIGGEDIAGLTAIQAADMSHDKVAYMIHDQDGRCVDRGNRTDVVIDAVAAIAYDDAVWRALNDEA